MLTIDLNLSKKSLLRLGGFWRILEFRTNYGFDRKGHKLISFRIKYREDDVLLILQKDSPQGPRIAFVDGSNVENALAVLTFMVEKKRLEWHEDKYRMREFDK